MKIRRDGVSLVTVQAIECVEVTGGPKRLLDFLVELANFVTGETKVDSAYSLPKRTGKMHVIIIEETCVACQGP